MTSQASPRRRWFRFSLRELLALVALLGVPLGILIASENHELEPGLAIVGAIGCFAAWGAFIGARFGQLATGLLVGVLLFGAAALAIVIMLSRLPL